MKEKDYLLTLFLFAVSFLAKEQAVTLPLLLILIDWFCHRNLKEKALCYRLYIKRMNRKNKRSQKGNQINLFI